jgi:putative tryptophan/tyrosine transport system substrate-binding protein
MRRVGVLFAGAENDPNQQADQAKFSDALRGSGWMQGRNITVDYRWAGGDPHWIQMFAKELVDLKPDLLLGQSTPVIAALKSETGTIPKSRGMSAFGGIADVSGRA